MRTVTLLLPSLILILCCATRGEEKIPPPDAAKQKEIEASVREIFADDFKKTRPDQKIDLARILIQHADDSKDPAERFVLRKEAANLYAQIGDVNGMISALDPLSEGYTPGPTAMMLDAVTLALANTKDAELVKVLTALKKLAAAQTDAAANLVVGRHLGLVRQKWERAFPYLANGADPVLKSLATKELAKPADAAAQLAIADEWWDFSEKQTVRDAKVASVERSQFWYAKVLPTATGLVKFKVEKRLVGAPTEYLQAAKTPPKPVAEPAKIKAAPPAEASEPPAPPLNIAPGAKEISLDLGKGIKLELVLIPAGTYTQGSPANEPDRKPEETQRSVTISKPFYLGKYEVTQEQWQALTGFNPSGSGRGPRHPVENVSYYDTHEFLDRLTRRTGALVRLPTEAEWEYACRAGTTTAFNAGNDEADFAAVAWYETNSGGKTHPVGEKHPNEFGLYDMHGNVWEWCSDFNAPYPKDAATDPKGPETGSEHVARGGCFKYKHNRCRSAERMKPPNNDTRGYGGFRVAVTIGAAVPPVPPAAPKLAEGLKEMSIDLGGGAKLDLVLIPAGTYLRGSPVTERDRKPEEILHAVTISKPFYIGKYEVTQAQWKALMGNNPAKSGTGDDRPVEMVSWNDIQGFLKKASERSQTTVRLPTEAEWEYACRAGSTTTFYLGDTVIELTAGAWYHPNSGNKSHSVGEKLPNAFGLYDMHGNVWEWCADYFGEYPKEAVTDPTGPATGKNRVARGGGMNYSANRCRSAARASNEPQTNSAWGGFRVVVVPK